ncbi:MAG TPA: LCP family protein [Rubrobacteraceae bacterium]|nr:LCP family protein [Rubrobacteraceae bacterium]
MKVYRSGRRPGRERERRDGRLRPVLLVLLALCVLFLAYLLLPIGGNRAVLLGSDARADEASRSDTIVVAKAGGGMLAVPRDTLVEIPGVGQDKINAAFANGGPELTVETLEKLTGLSIGNYVVVDFGGVEEIVNALGGITIDVEEPISYTLDGRPVSIPAGTQELDGPQALGYVRYRGDPTADIGRIGRQQRFLQALATEATSPSKLLRLPATARAVWRNIDTNMNPIAALRFAIRMRLADMGEAELYPGTPKYIDGISYWVPDKDAGREVVTRTVE